MFSRCPIMALWGLDFLKTSSNNVIKQKEYVILCTCGRAPWPPEGSIMPAHCTCGTKQSVNTQRLVFQNLHGTNKLPKRRKHKPPMRSFDKCHCQNFKQSTMGSHGEHQTAQEKKKKNWQKQQKRVLQSDRWQPAIKWHILTVLYQWRNWPRPGVVFFLSR